jgi:hypothetical protein
MKKIFIQVEVPDDWDNLSHEGKCLELFRKDDNWTQVSGEPVGTVTQDGFSMLYGHKPLPPGTDLFAAPQPLRELSDEEIKSIAYDCNALPEVITDETLIVFARAIAIRSRSLK